MAKEFSYEHFYCETVEELLNKRKKLLVDGQEASYVTATPLSDSKSKHHIEKIVLAINAIPDEELRYIDMEKIAIAIKSLGEAGLLVGEQGADYIVTIMSPAIAPHLDKISEAIFSLHLNSSRAGGPEKVWSYVADIMSPAIAPYAHEFVRGIIHLQRPMRGISEEQRIDYITAIKSPILVPYAETIADAIVYLHVLSKDQRRNAYIKAVMSPSCAPYAYKIALAIVDKCLYSDLGFPADPSDLPADPSLTQSLALAHKIADLYDLYENSSVVSFKAEEFDTIISSPVMVEILHTMYLEKLFEGPNAQEHFALIKICLLGEVEKPSAAGESKLPAGIEPASSSVRQKALLPLLLQALKQLQEAKKLNEKTFRAVVADPLGAIPYLAKVADVTPDAKSPVVRGYKDILNFSATHKHHPDPQYRPEARLDNLPSALKDKVMTFVGGEAGDLQLKRHLTDLLKPPLVREAAASTAQKDDNKRSESSIKGLQ